MKILFITPHLSTGGAPQYLLKKIQELNLLHDLYCVEYDNITGGVLVVQRSQIQSILKDKLITLDSDKTRLIKIINDICPDIVHFEEMPEFFMDQSVAKLIYNSNRTYKLIETSHDSSFDPDNKIFYPDRFVFVSNYQREKFKTLNIPSDVVEYPIVYKKKEDRTQSLIKLGLDPSKTHILNIGLFTQRKNQSEIIDYAKRLLNENVQFHFVGNQADNFRWYWEPLMKDFPANCKWWGERKDVDTFYNAMDVFLFTSKGTSNDKETSPLVIREAIGWNMPILMYNLDVYIGMYDMYKNIDWLTNEVNKNLDIIKSKINAKNIMENFDELFGISFNAEQNKFDISYKKSEEKTYTFVFKDVDSNASMYYFTATYANYNGMWAIPIPIGTYSFIDQPSFRGVRVEVYDADKKIICYKDLYIKNVEKIRTVYLNTTDPFDCLFNNYNEMFVHKKYDGINIENYLDSVVDVGANSGLFTKMCLEKGANRVISVEPNQKCLKNLRSIVGNDNRVDVVENAVSNERKKVKFYTTPDNSTIGSIFRNRVMNEYQNINEIEVDCLTISDIIASNNLNKISMLKLDVEGAEYDILYSIDTAIFEKIDSILLEYHNNNDGRIKTINEFLYKNGFINRKFVDQSESTYDKVENGTIFYTKTTTNKNLKIKLVHLQTTSNDSRELKSSESLSVLKNHGIDYIVHKNQIYTSIPPVHLCSRPLDVSYEKNNNDSLTPAHYGCYESFRLGILSEFDNDLDYIIVCEGDCILEVDPETFVDTIYKLHNVLNTENIDYFSFGDTRSLETSIVQSNPTYVPENQDLCFVTDKIIGLQCVMFSKRIRKNLFDYLRTAKWDAADIYFNTYCHEKNIKMGILKKRITTQCDGYSILDKTYKKFI